MSGHDVSDELRDEHGRWTAGGAGADTSSDPRVTDVGGDKWNQETAKRLENEYAAVRPALDALAKGVEGNRGRVENNEDDNENFHAGVPESWDDMSSSQQDDAETAYKDNNYDSALESEQASWSDSGEALGQAKSALAADEDWKHEKIGDFLTNRQEEGLPRVPYTVGQLADAVKLDFPNNGSGDDEVEITYDDDKLQKPDTAPPENQLTFPGVEKPNLSALLPNDVREDLKNFLEKEFVSDAESNADKIEPPEYLADSAKEYLGDAWGQMDDGQKFEYAQEHNILPEEDGSSETTALHEPNHYDPLNTTDDEDYKRTQAMSHYLFDNRVQQVMKDRNIGVGSTSAPPDLGDLRRADREMWTDWKGSSTTQNGLLMQVASADELGGRLRGMQRPDDETLRTEFDKWKGEHPGVTISFDKFKDNWVDYVPRQKGAITTTTGERVLGPDGEVFTRLPDISVVKNGLASTTTDAKVANDWGGVGDRAPAGIDREAVIAQANKEWADIGGYEGVKAMMRAKWETTQYMLDRADMPTLEVYRGINMEHSHTHSDWTSNSPLQDQGSEKQPNVQHPSTAEWIKPGDADYEKYLGTLHSGEDTIKEIADDYAKSPHVLPPYYKAADALNPDQAKMIVNKYGSIQTALRSAAPRTTTRVVLRAQVPRTAALSVPAYGINQKSEKEVVIAGTAWKSWEAYSNKAPRYDQAKAHAPAASVEDVNQLSYKQYVKGSGVLPYADWLKVNKPEKAHSILIKTKSKP